MDIRIIQLNISLKSKAVKIAEYLNSNIKGPTIINLQEVLQSSHETIFTILQPDDMAYSLDLRKPGKNEGKNRRLGVATYIFGGSIISRKLISRSVFPERSLFTEINFKGTHVNSFHFHSLTGVDYKKAKSSNFASIADFIQSENIDFFTCDANEPKIDSLDNESIKFFDNKDKGVNAGLIFGGNKIHDLNDALKVYLKGMRKNTNEEPLAVSHIISKRFKRRYDHIYCSDSWLPNKVVYPYNDSINATTDHSAVIADLTKISALKL